MLRIPHADARAVAFAEAIRQGDIRRLGILIADHREMLDAWIVDDKTVGRTLLHIATDWPGHFPDVAQTIAALMDAGADPGIGVDNSPHAAPEKPLHWAASSNDVAALAALLDHGADIEATGALFTDGTAMDSAVIFAQWDAARLLCDRGAQVKLWQAAALGLHEQMVEQFRQRRLSQDELHSALWHACRGGQLAPATFLLDAGAQINWVGFRDWTPLDAAVESGSQELIRALRERGALTAEQVGG